MKINIGDFVRFLNDEGEGKVIAFPSEFVALVEDSSGFAFEHEISELVLVANHHKELQQYNSIALNARELLDRNIDANAVNEASKDFKKRYKDRLSSEMPSSKSDLEVDLHIHELVDHYSGMSNGEIVELQMQHFERMLRIAEERKIKKIVFIHGVGQGVLRQEIRLHLRKYYPQCEFLDGNYQKYGHGATEVRFRK
ncbi:MAG: Smr/MutS family protein [Bacteroidota bacterium]|jgi:dsDNA-specific endonuclease/ATPase MutS2